MKTLTRLAITLMALLVVGGLTAQEPAQVGPKIYRQKLDNERVRVFEIMFRPGQKIGSHAHPDHVVYVTQGGTLKIVESGKAPVTMKVKAGDTVFMKAQTHWAQNVGKTTFKAVVVEIKGNMTAPSSRL